MLDIHFADNRWDVTLLSVVGLARLFCSAALDLVVIELTESALGQLRKHLINSDSPFMSPSNLIGGGRLWHGN